MKPTNWSEAFEHLEKRVQALEAELDMPHEEEENNKDGDTEVEPVEPTEE